METRASYIVIGAFVLVFAIGMAVFIAWISQATFDRDFAFYKVRFEGAVTGLQQGSAVRLNGLPVGVVTTVRLDRELPGTVETVLRLGAETPVLDGAVARLEALGLTGGVFVQITGGDGAPIRPLPGEQLAEIPSAPSNIQSALESLPQVTAQAVQLLENANRLLAAQNQDAVLEILVNIQTLTEVLATESRALGQLSGQAASLVENLDTLVVSLNRDTGRLVDRADQLMATATGQLDQVGRTADRTVAELGTVARTVEGTASRINTLLDENRTGIETFTSEGLFELSLMISEVRGLAQTLNRLSERLERDPAQFLFGGTRGVSAE